MRWILARFGDLSAERRLSGMKTVALLSVACVLGGAGMPLWAQAPTGDQPPPKLHAGRFGELTVAGGVASGSVVLSPAGERRVIVSGRFRPEIWKIGADNQVLDTGYFRVRRGIRWDPGGVGELGGGRVADFVCGCAAVEGDGGKVPGVSDDRLAGRPQQGGRVAVLRAGVGGVPGSGVPGFSRRPWRTAARRRAAGGGRAGGFI